MILMVALIACTGASRQTETKADTFWIVGTGTNRSEVAEFRLDANGGATRTSSLRIDELGKLEHAILSPSAARILISYRASKAGEESTYVLRTTPVRIEKLLPPVQRAGWFVWTSDRSFKQFKFGLNPHRVPVKVLTHTAPAWRETKGGVQVVPRTSTVPAKVVARAISYLENAGVRKPWYWETHPELDPSSFSSNAYAAVSSNGERIVLFGNLQDTKEELASFVLVEKCAQWRPRALPGRFRSSRFICFWKRWIVVGTRDSNDSPLIVAFNEDLQEAWKIAGSAFLGIGCKMPGEL